MELRANRPMPVPPVTYDILGLTRDEISILRSLLGRCNCAIPELHRAIGPMIELNSGMSEHHLVGPDGATIPTIFICKKG